LLRPTPFYLQGLANFGEFIFHALFVNKGKKKRKGRSPYSSGHNY
jgi:hypothetical protein